MSAAEDDREALARVLEREFGSFLAHDPFDPAKFWGGSADTVLAAGFRRLPVTERSHIPVHSLRYHDGDGHFWLECSIDGGPWLRVASGYGDFLAQHDQPCPGDKPVTEPTEAQVEAADDAYWRVHPDSGYKRAMRAALVAAREAGQ